MSLQDILKKIQDEAETSVKKIEEELEKKKKELQQESKEKEAEEQQKLEEKTAIALSAVEDKTRSMARRENKKILLSTKQELVENALSKFLEMLEGADEKNYSQLLEKLFSRISASSGKVFAPAKRLEITSKAAPPGFDVVAHKDLTGGFILKAGESEVDNSFHNLVFSEFREPLTAYFAEQLKLV